MASDSMRPVPGAERETVRLARLLSELLTSHHEERSGTSRAAELHVDEILH